MAIQSDQEFAPTQIARAVFPTAFRGYDQDAVRRYLSRLASALEHQQEYAGLGELEARTPAHERVEELETEVEDLRQEIRDLELELVQRSVSGENEKTAEPDADAVPFDEHRAIELLGKETARVLESARSAAADILKRAETQAASLKSQAKSELAEARRRSDTLLTEAQTETEALTARLTNEAEAEAERISNEAQEHREAVLEESSKILSEAEALAENEQADAEARAQQIVADAETLRQQVVSELVAERREAQLDMERIKAARDRLAMSLAVARSELDEVADALVDASVSQDERAPSVPVPVGGRSHREEVAGLIEQLESGADTDADSKTESADNADAGSDDDDKTTTADQPSAEDEPQPGGTQATAGSGSSKDSSANASAKRNNRSAKNQKAAKQPSDEDTVAADGGLRVGGKGDGPADDAADAAGSSSGDASETDTTRGDRAGSSGTSAGDHNGAAAKATDGVRASVKQKKNGRSRKNQQKGKRANASGGGSNQTRSPNRASSQNKTGGSGPAEGKAAASEDDELVSVIDAALSDEQADTGDDATADVTADDKADRNRSANKTGNRKAVGTKTETNEADAKKANNGKKAAVGKAKVEAADSDDDLVNVLGETDETLDLDSVDGADGADNVDDADDAELNKLPADGEALSLVEGFTTIDVGDIDLRTDGDGDASGGEAAKDGGGAVDAEAANPELVHSVVVNEPQIPEDVITTVASRTATSGSERTQGDLLVEQPFTGRLPKEFAARDLALTRSGPNFRRQLRRALNDDQSDVLDRLRAGRGAITVDELPSFNDQIERYHAPLRRGLAEIAQAGAKVGGQADLSHAALDNLVRQLAKYIVDRVRVPTMQVVDEDTDGDRERILEPIRALYRDFRNVGLPDLSEDALYEAFAIGLYDSIEPSAPVSWVLDPRSDPDPVCDINSQREDVVKGATFPSGHARPLSLPGCRCLVTLADY